MARAAWLPAVWLIVANGCTTPGPGPRHPVSQVTATLPPGTATAIPSEAPTLAAGPFSASCLPEGMQPAVPSSSRHVAIPATQGVISTNFDANIAGTAGAALAVMINHDAGTVNVSGRALSAVAYAQQRWDSQGYVLYQTLAVSAGCELVLWLYCSGNRLSYVYFESTDGLPMTRVSATGTCAAVNGSTQPAVSFPALDQPVPRLAYGFNITGDVQLNGATPGAITLRGRRSTLYVFDTVDCSSRCGSPGWYELHALIWDLSVPRLAFGIIYLKSQDTHHVDLEYGLSLPDLTRLDGLLYTADWQLAS
jgi:hypothetical protein